MWVDKVYYLKISNNNKINLINFENLCLNVTGKPTTNDWFLLVMRHNDH